MLRLMLPVPEAYVGTIHDGEPVTVSVPALNRSLPGKLTRFSDRVQASTRTMTAEVDIKNTNRELIPGMYAQVQLTLADSPNAVAVPIGAIDGEGSAGKVYVVDRCRDSPSSQCRSRHAISAICPDIVRPSARRSCHPRKPFGAGGRRASTAARRMNRNENRQMTIG